MDPANSNGNHTITLAALLHKLEQYPSIISFLIEPRIATITRASEVANKDNTVFDVPDLVGLSAMAVMKIVASTIFGDRPQVAELFIKQQEETWQRLSPSEPYLQTRHITWLEGIGCCITVDFTLISDVTDKVLGYAVEIKTTQLEEYPSQIICSQAIQQQKFIEDSATEEFIYSVDPHSYTITAASHQARKKFARLGIPNLIGMNVFLVIWTCSIKLYPDNERHRERFVDQQLLAWHKLLELGQGDTTQHVFKWGRDGGGQRITVVFDALSDEHGNIECCTVAVTAEIVNAVQYHMLEQRDMLFIPSPEIMAA